MLVFIYLILALTVAPIMNGFAISTLWGWFIVPMFGLPALSIPYAIGLSLIVSYMTISASFYKGQAIEVDKYISFLVTKPVGAIIFGFIVKQFI